MHAILGEMHSSCGRSPWICYRWWLHHKGSAYCSRAWKRQPIVFWARSRGQAVRVLRRSVWSGQGLQGSVTGTATEALYQHVLYSPGMTQAESPELLCIGQAAVAANLSANFQTFTWYFSSWTEVYTVLWHGLLASNSTPFGASGSLTALDSSRQQIQLN